MSKRALLGILCCALLASACSVGTRRRVTSTREVADFDRVVFEGIGELNVSLGTHESLTIEAETNVITRITTEVRSDILYIGYRGGVFGLNVVPTRPIRYNLTMRSLQGLDLSGLGTINAGEIATDRLSVDIGGAGKVTIRSLSADRLALTMSGLGACEVAGQVRQQDVLITGGGDYDAARLASDEAELTLTGLGKATVRVAEDLNVTITGIGGVEYYGNPRVSQNVSGLGRVNSLGQR